MNIHPLFVHFPIALLVAYSVLEVSGFVWPASRRVAWVFPVKAFLLFTGVLTALLALATGGIAEELVEGVDPRSYILEVHAPFAAVTTLIYIILAAAYLNRVFDRNGWFNQIVTTNSFFAWGWSVKKRLAHLVLDTWVLPLLAVAGFILMIITGALGAAVVYGPSVDPLVSFVYHLFWVQ